MNHYDTRFTPVQIKEAKTYLASAIRTEDKTPEMIFGFGKSNIWLKIGDFLRDRLIKSYKKDLMRAYQTLGFEVYSEKKHH